MTPRQKLFRTGEAVFHATTEILGHIDQATKTKEERLIPILKEFAFALESKAPYEELSSLFVQSVQAFSKVSEILFCTANGCRAMLEELRAICAAPDEPASASNCSAADTELLM